LDERAANQVPDEHGPVIDASATGRPDAVLAVTSSIEARMHLRATTSVGALAGLLCPEVGPRPGRWPSWYTDDGGRIALWKRWASEVQGTGIQAGHLRSWQRFFAASLPARGDDWCCSDLGQASSDHAGLVGGVRSRSLGDLEDISFRVPEIGPSRVPIRRDHHFSDRFGPSFDELAVGRLNVIDHEPNLVSRMIVFRIRRSTK
jgi:hypothetical protein